MDKYVRYLERLMEGPAHTVGYLGTRDEQMQVSVVFLMGFKVKANPFRVVVYIPESALGHTARNLKISDYATLLLINGGTFEGIQIKGNTVLGPGDAEGEAAFRNNMERLKKFYNSEEFYKPVAITPLLAAEISVKEIYNQTPGAGAGDRLKLEEGGSNP